VSSDSDLEVVGDPAVEEREWRLRKAAAGGRILRGTTDVGGAELPRSHLEEICRATEETRKRFRDRETGRRRRDGRRGCNRTTISPVICKIRHTQSKKEKTVHVGELKKQLNEQTAETSNI